MNTYEHVYNLSLDVRVRDSSYEDGSDCLEKEREWVLSELLDKLEKYLYQRGSLEEIFNLKETIEVPDLGYDPLKEKTKNDLVMRVS